MKNEEFDYPIGIMLEALNRKRLGGNCLFNLCGCGETMAQNGLIPLVKGLLQEGHYVSITTNGTISKKYDELIESCGNLLSHLHVAFSFHYVELKKRGWVEIFFENVLKMRKAGASILVQFNLCDEYLPYLDEIKAVCLEKVGAYPQVALTRDEMSKPMKIMTKGSCEDYYRIGKEFDSPLFDFTYKNFMVKRTEYCYAGAWSGVLNMQSGILSQCYMNGRGVNIFEDTLKPIKFRPVGHNCNNPYCVNSSHFMSLGIIPEIDTPTYSSLRNRSEAKWQTPEMRNVLCSKLYDINKPYSKIKKKYYSLTEHSLRENLSKFKFYQTLHKIKEHFND